MSSSTGAFSGFRLSSFSSESSSTSSARSGSTSSTPNSASSDAIGHAEDFFAAADRQTQPRQPGPTLDAYTSSENDCHGVEILNAALASAPLDEGDIVTAWQAGQRAVQGSGARDRHSVSRLFPLGSQQDSQKGYLLDGSAREVSSSLSEHVKISHACLEDCAHSSDTMPAPLHTLQLEQAGGRDPVVFCLDNRRSSAPWHYGEHTSNRSQMQQSSAPKSGHGLSSSQPHIQVSSPSPTPSPWQSSFGALTHATINVPSLRLDTAMPARSSSEPLSGASASGVSKTMAFFNFDGASSEAEEGLLMETDRRRSSVPLESPSNLPANASVHGTAATEVEEAPPAGQATLPDQRSGSMTSQPSEMDRDKKASSHRAPYAPTFVDLRTATEQRKRKLEDTAIEDFNTNAAMGTEHTPWFTSEITSAMTGSYRKIAETGSSEAPKAPASRARGVSDPESNWFDARVPGQSDSEAPSHGAEAADLTSSVTLAQDDSLLAEAARRPSREREARASHSSNLATEVNGNAPSTLETLASNWWQQGAAQTPWLSGISPSNPALRRATVIGNLRSTNEPYEHSELTRDPPSSEAAGQYSFQPQPHDGWYQEDLEIVHPTSSGLGESSSFEGRRRSRPTAIATAALASTATTQPHAESTGLTSNPIAPLPARRTIPAGGSANLSGSADYGAHFGAFLRSCEQNVGPPQLALEHYAPSSPATASFFAGAATMASSMPNAAPAALPSASTGRSTPALVAGSSRSGGVSTPLSWDERPDEFDIQRQARIRASTHAGSYGYNVMSGAADPGFWEPLDRDAFTANQALSYDTPQRSLRVESMPGTQNPFRSAAYAQQARSGAYASPAAIQARQAQTYGQADVGSSHQAAGASCRPLAGLQRADTYTSLRDSSTASQSHSMPHSSSSPALLSNTNTRMETPPPSFAPSFETEDIVLRALPNSLAGDVLYPSRQSLPNTALQPPNSDFDVAADQQEEALPRNQSDKLRFRGDLYTPAWVRGTGNSREAWCDKCEEGGWMQLKNSQYWYHVRGTHGISPTSGLIFLPPLKLKCYADAVGTTEGLCHHCHKWIQICTAKRKRDFSGWFKHSAKCHPSTSGVRVSSDVPAPAPIYGTGIASTPGLQTPGQDYMQTASSSGSHVSFQQQETAPLPPARRQYSHAVTASGMPASISGDPYYYAPSSSGTRRQTDTTAADSVNYAQHPSFNDERNKRRRK